MTGWGNDSGRRSRPRRSRRSTSGTGIRSNRSRRAVNGAERRYPQRSTAAMKPSVDSVVRRRSVAPRVASVHRARRERRSNRRSSLRSGPRDRAASLIQARGARSCTIRWTRRSTSRAARKSQLGSREQPLAQRKPLARSRGLELRAVRGRQEEDDSFRFGHSRRVDQTRPRLLTQHG